MWRLLLFLNLLTPLLAATLEYPTNKPPKPPIVKQYSDTALLGHNTSHFLVNSSGVANYTNLYIYRINNSSSNFPNLSSPTWDNKNINNSCRSFSKSIFRCISKQVYALSDVKKSRFHKLYLNNEDNSICFKPKFAHHKNVMNLFFELCSTQNKVIRDRSKRSANYNFKHPNSYKSEPYSESNIPHQMLHKQNTPKVGYTNRDFSRTGALSDYGNREVQPHRTG